MRILLNALALLLLGAFLLRGVAAPPPEQVEARGTLTLGWEAYFPYQVMGDYPTGLDTELLRTALARAGYQLELRQQSWATSLDQVEKGDLQGLSLAFDEPERREWAWFSRPYLSLRTAVFFRQGEARPPSTLPELAEFIRVGKLRVGRAAGYAYPEPVKRVFADATTVMEPLEEECLEDLATGRVDIVFADELSGVSVLLKRRWNGALGCAVLDLPARPVSLILSKKSVPPEAAQRIDQAIQAMDESGEIAEIVRTYYYPTLLNLLGRGWFFGEIGVLAAAAAAISGLLIARRSGYNLVGTFLLAAAPAAGGGLIRDLVAGRHPVAVVADPSILVTVLCMVLATDILLRLYRLPDDVENHPLVIFLDSLGLAAFTVIGVVVAMQTRCEPLWLWGPLLAALTNGGGSVLRDLLRNRPPGMVEAGRLYLEISMAWGLALSLFLQFYSRFPVPRVGHLQAAVATTLVGVIVTRYLALRLNWQRPLFSTGEP